MKTAMQIYVLWHKNYEYGIELANEIFFQFNRNPDKSYKRGIGIPVYFRNLAEEYEKVYFENSEITAIVVLIDDFMITTDEWKEYINELYKYRSDNIKFYMVACSKNAINLSNKISQLNFIRLYEDDMYQLKDSGLSREKTFNKVLICELAHEFCRLFYNEGHDNDPLKIFLSHTKRDIDNKGEIIAKELNLYIQGLSKAKSFYDRNDIAISYDFWKEIEKNIQKSFLLIIYSDNYTSSQWCRKEVIAAKKYNRPALIINLYDKGESRIFPYAANIQVVHVIRKLTKEDKYISNLDCFNIICSIFKEALRFKFQERELNIKLGMFKEKEKTEVFSRPPELLDYSIKNINCKEYILYPEPPLGDEELEILKNIFKGFKFITPTLIFKKNNFINGKKIGISISEISNEQKKLKFFALKDIMVEIIRYIFYLDGDVVYGGNLKYNDKSYNLLMAMIHVLEEYKSEYFKNCEHIKDKKIINYIPYPTWKTIDVHDKADYSNCLKIMQIEPHNVDINKDYKYLFVENSNQVNYIWAKSLTKMREKLSKDINIHIIMGGKCSGFKGIYPGILEEFLLSAKNLNHIYILGGFGGCSKEIIKLLQGQECLELDASLQNDSYNDFLKYYNSIDEVKVCYEEDKNFIKAGGINILNNGLTKEENEILFKSENVTEILQFILKGIENIYLSKRL